MKISGTGQSPQNYAQNAQNRMKPQDGDSFSKDIRSRIDSLQKQIEKLSENKDIDPKERAKRKEELQGQITELQQQLSQHEIEKEREKTSGGSENDSSRRCDRFERSDEADSMNSAISADLSLRQAETRGQAARSLRGKMNVLKSEIKQDGSRGASTERKQAELAKLSAQERKTAAAESEETKKAAKKASGGSRTAAGLEFLKSLKDKIPGTEFFIGTVSYGQTYGNSTDNNFVVHPKYLEKLGSDPEAQKQFEESVTALNDFSNQFRASQARQGREVISEGWFCDEDGNWGGWTVTRKTDGRSHLQEMREQADKINEAKAERKKEQEKLDEKREAEKTAEAELKEKLDKLKDTLGGKFLDIEIREEN